MLKDSKIQYVKPSHIYISEEQWNEMKLLIREGILKKIKTVKHLQKVDKDIAAGLYVYAVEEFGKLLLFNKAPSFNGRRKVKYDKEFVDHKKKIEAAFNYFQNNDFHACMMLAQGCSGEISDVKNRN